MFLINSTTVARDLEIILYGEYADIIERPEDSRPYLIIYLMLPLSDHKKSKLFLF